MVHINTQIIFVLLLATLFLTGCEEEVYTQFCNEKTLHVKCLNIQSLDSSVDTLLKESLLHVDISNECPFTLQGIHYKVDACKNPVANSVGADFDGYVKLQVFHNGTCYYRIQQDFKSSPWQERMRHIVKRLQKDLNL